MIKTVVIILILMHDMTLLPIPLRNLILYFLLLAPAGAGIND